MVYRSLSSNDLSYIPKHNDSKIVKLQSRLKIKSDGQVVCEESVELIEVYELIRNSPEITGIDRLNNYDFATVVIEEDKRSTRSLENSSEYKYRWVC